MKANHRPVQDRLRQRISTLSLRLDDMWTSKRFYPKCKGCGKTNIQVSIDGGRHHKGCSYQGIERQIAYYQRLLSEVA